jgi:hypothetical protein
MPRTTNAAGRIRDESLMNLGGRGVEQKIIFNIYLVDLSEQTSNVTATFEITKNGIISPKAGEQMYRI